MTVFIVLSFRTDHIEEVFDDGQKANTYVDNNGGPNVLRIVSRDVK